MGQPYESRAVVNESHWQHSLIAEPFVQEGTMARLVVAYRSQDRKTNRSVLASTSNRSGCESGSFGLLCGKAFVKKEFKPTAQPCLVPNPGATSCQHLDWL
jgi:hypothetical protein